MKPKYVVYYPFVTTQSVLPAEIREQYVQSLKSEGEIVDQVAHEDLNESSWEALERAVRRAREAQATLVVMNLNRLDVSLEFYQVA